VLDRHTDVRIVADVVGDIAEIFVAFKPTGLNHQEIILIARSLAPEPDVMAWDVSDSLAETPLRPGEIAFQLMTGA